MFGLSRPTAYLRVSTGRRVAQLTLEQLEARDLLAASFTTLAAAPVVSGLHAFTGSAVATPASQGPTIVDFGAVEEGPDLWTFQGRVIGDDVVGLEVDFGGLPSVEGRTAVVEDDGWFHLTIRLPHGVCGAVTAQTTDHLGNPSNEAVTLLCPTESGDHLDRAISWPALETAKPTDPPQTSMPSKVSFQPAAINNAQDDTPRQPHQAISVLSGPQSRRSVPAAGQAFELAADAFGF
jgi:hypothetical protein